MKQSRPRPAARVTVPAADSETADCACARPVGPGGRAEAVDPAIKTRTKHRLRRIEGQVRGLQQMVEQERYCADILAQIASVQEALRASARELLQNHLRHCARRAFGKGPAEADAMIAEIGELMRRHR